MSAPLDLAQLRTLVAIADTGGYTRAAAALHVSQPTVSGHVRVLERRLKQVLLEREGRGARFTDDGERLLAEARRVLAVHDEALARLETGARRTVVVGSTETAAEGVLPTLLTTLRDAFPDRPVRFVIDRSTGMTESVARGTIDLAVLLGWGPATPGRQVGTLPLRWYGRPGGDASDGGRSDGGRSDGGGPDDEVPLVAYAEPCGMRRRALAELAEAGRRVRLTAESTTLDGVVAAARAGLGVAVLPSAGAPPAGLVERTDLPPLGVIGLHLATRAGLDVDLEAAALGALETFVAGLPGLTAAVVPAAPVATPARVPTTSHPDTSHRAASHPGTSHPDTDREDLT
ncbi:LysR family transcriptional regulator [Cellulomonas marina]|uniref:DNA-binding transcriptional regulator, LysR family n=1 Tax=Cellulomonas marina TaxID=988821 RepID=A0A1I0ZGD1_9CELL|nr:LysR family transcriptional regulator [Cellulomonas marina]GIG28530.1 LysR family transcriptional regulator [Cellulomonas marina]SFB24432.1 DNA-binding transcriptional regulator, LysR family [Cellulomonas marina]